jgi:lambda family phage portal protein
MAWPFALVKRAFSPLRRRSLEAASPRRPWGAPLLDGFGHASVDAGAHAVRRKAQHAAVNNPHAASGVAAWITAAIGAGITPATSVAAEVARAAIGSGFDQWCPRAGLDGNDFFALQSEVMRALVVDGEAFLHLAAEPGGLTLRQIPADAVDMALSRELGGNARIINGVEFDSAGRRAAYHVRPDLGFSSFVSVAPPIRVPAVDMLHVFKPLFPGQIRGVSWLAPVLLLLGELDQLEDALLVAAKVSAMMMGFLTDQNGTGPNPFGGDGQQTGSVLTGGMEPGTLKVLPSGWDIKLSTPQQMATAMDLAKHQLRAVAAGLGVPEHLLTGDLSGANYSSLRAGLVAFRQRVEQVQHHILVPQLLRPVWRRWLTLEILAGRIDAPNFEADPASWLGVEWYPPPMPWVDPAKDSLAEEIAIRAGLKSRRQAVAERGYSVEALDAEIAADRAREARLGLSFGQPPQPQQPAQPPRSGQEDA